MCTFTEIQKLDMYMITIAKKAKETYEIRFLCYKLHKLKSIILCQRL